MEILSGTEARRMEPLLSKRVRKALYAPTTGIISPLRLSRRWQKPPRRTASDFFSALKRKMFCCRKAGYRIPVRRGGGGKKTAAIPGEPAWVVTSKGTITTRFIVNTAGRQRGADRKLCASANLVIRPRRGQFTSSISRKARASHVIYQVQENDEKGTLIAPTVEGNLIAGPTSENVSSYENTDTTRAGLDHVEPGSKKILPDLDMGRSLRILRESGRISRMWTKNRRIL